MRAHFTDLVSPSVRRLVVAATSIEQAEVHAVGRVTDMVGSEVVSVDELGPRLYEVLVRQAVSEREDR